MRACCIIHNMLVENRRKDYIGDGIGGIRSTYTGIDRNMLAEFVLEPLGTQVLNGMPVNSQRVSADIKSKGKRAKILNALVDHASKFRK